MKTLLVFISLCSTLCLAQNNFIHQSDFYKDQGLRFHRNYFPDGAYPKNEFDFDLVKALNDSSKQYYTVTEILFKKHLVEIKGDGFNLNISPILDLSMGRDLSDTLSRSLFRNTRGIYVEGDLGSNFSFSSEFHENQGRFAYYQSEFYASHGELYPNPSGYGQQNAVIPGEGRTKPFKDDGFDFAFAIGNIIYRPHKNLLLSAGNTSHFIGEGSRSLLLGNENGFAPFLRADWQISPKVKFSYQKSRHLNLLRRVATSSAEAYYEPKSFTMLYFTWKPSEKIGLSLFEGTQWSRGDSIVSTFAPAQSFLPVPFVNPLSASQNQMSSVLGINLNCSLTESTLLYAQSAISNIHYDDLATQLGVKTYQSFGKNEFFAQLEYNYIPPIFYENDSTQRLSYSHYNMPLAHILGNHVSEIISRLGYVRGRIYADLTLSYSDRGAQENTVLLPTSNGLSVGNTSVFYTSFEGGYRFNRKMNLCFFIQAIYRTQNTRELNESIVSFGLKTAIKNRSQLF